MNQGEPTIPHVTGAIDQLRAILCVLVLALVLSAGAYTVFIFKQGRQLQYQLQHRRNQWQQCQRVDQITTELMRYCADKPDLAAVFARYGLQPAPDNRAGQP